VIACTSRDETNLVAAMFSKRVAPRTTTVMRASNVEYLELWREGQLDVDFVVSSELETAAVISRTIGVPAARQTDVFANGQVQIVEFDVEEGAAPTVVGMPLREAAIPPESKVASIIRGDAAILPRGDAVIEPGDRIVVIGSPRAAQAWSQLIGTASGQVRDVVVFGAGRVGTAVARLLLEQGMGVRIIEADGARARMAAELIPAARVYHATGLDPDFLDRERIGDAHAAVFAMREDERNHFAAVLAKVHGVRFTISIVHESASVPVFEAAGIDVTVNPRGVTAEEIVRFAHDPRTQQVAMFEGNRYEVLDIITRPESEYVGKRFRDMPIRGALIGAVVRDGEALFPRGDDVLEAGDRVILFTESQRVPTVERAL
jgi:trk system potassium uptake protein